MSNDGFPKSLKPYRFHGLPINYQKGQDNTYTTCPFCGGDKKFSIEVESGKWRCFVCNEGNEKGQVIKGGNVYTFLRKLHEESALTTDPDDLKTLAKQRKLLKGSTLRKWGVCRSIVNNDWLLPGYNIDGKLCQLYRYVFNKQEGKWLLLATAGLEQQLFGVDRFDPKKSVVYVFEGPWDAMAMYEVFSQSRFSLESLVPSGNPKECVLAEANILAVPGAMTFFDGWCELFNDKEVVLCYDSDQPKVHKPTGRVITAVGYEAMKRVTQTMAASEYPPKEVGYIKWGENGYDPTLPSGYDVRDHLSKSKTTNGRIEQAGELMKKVVAIPEDWIQGRSKEQIEKGATDLELLPCHKWTDLVKVWRKTMQWTEGLDRGLSVCLACICSTKAIGQQLWIKLIGPPSSGKTTLVEALGTSKKYVVMRSSIRGFHSGFRSERGSDKEDNSLIAQLLDKTLVTKDGDTLMSSPQLPLILSEARDLYDGSTSASYRTGRNNIYEGLRITWILCGTSSLRKLDSSELGERFLDCIVMRGIDDELEDSVLWQVVNKANRSMSFESNGQVQHQKHPDRTKAMQMTGGYVEYLRANATQLLKKVKFPHEKLKECALLAKFVSYMRARPSKTQTETAEREFSPRLAEQLVRLAKCLAVVLNKREVDDEVMRRVAMVACDTSRGRSLKIVHKLYEEDKPRSDRALAIDIGDTDSNTKHLIVFLRKIGVVKRVTSNGMTKYKLSNLMHRLYTLVDRQVNSYDEELV